MPSHLLRLHHQLQQPQLQQLQQQQQQHGDQNYRRWRNIPRNAVGGTQTTNHIKRWVNNSIHVRPVSKILVPTMNLTEYKYAVLIFPRMKFIKECVMGFIL